MLLVRRALILLALVGCTNLPEEGDPPVWYPDAGWAPMPDAAPPVPTVLDGLPAGWRVTITRLAGDDSTEPPTETTQVTDGSSITILEDGVHVHAITITDGDGRLQGTQVLNSRCDVARATRLDVPAEYPTIQAAINAAQPGDVVEVAPGTYRESVQMRPYVCLIGSGANVTTLDAEGDGRSLITFGGAGGGLVTGFRFTGVAMPPGCANTDVFTCAGSWYAGGVHLGDAGDWVVAPPPIIVGNVFDGNDIGVFLGWGGRAIVRNNVFVGNRNGVVANHFQRRALIADNVFVDNTQLAIGNQSAYLDIVDNIVAGTGMPLRFEFIQQGWIQCNVFSGAGVLDPRVPVDGNLVADPLLTTDYHLAAGSPGLGAGCLDTDIGLYSGPFRAWVDR